MPKTNLCRSGAEICNENLIRWIKGSKVKQYELARLLGLSPASLSRKMATGRLNTAELITILHRLGATQEELAFLLLY